MKIFVYGAGDTAYLISSNLYKTHDVTLICDIEELPHRFSKLDMGFVSGSPSDLHILESSGIKSADVFIACSGVDEANIVGAWSVKKYAEIETVCFVSKIEYYKSFSSSGNDFQFSEIGVDHVIWPEELLVQDIFRIITVPSALDVEDFENGRARLLQYKINEDFELLNKSLKDCNFPESVLVVGITRENELFIPNGLTVFELADKVIFMGLNKPLNELSKKYFFKDSDEIKNVAIMGGGNIGYMLAVKLEEIGINTKIIESDLDRCDFLAEKLVTSLVVNADATDSEIFDEEELDECDVLIAVTNNDEKNLLASLLAKQKGVSKVFARVTSDSMAALFERVGIDITVSPKIVTMNAINDKILDKQTNILAVVERGQGEVLKIKTPPNLNNKFIRDIGFPVNAIIGAIKRGGKVIVPRGDTIIKDGDAFIIFVMSSNIDKVKEFLGRHED